MGTGKQPDQPLKPSRPNAKKKRASKTTLLILLALLIGLPAAVQLKQGWPSLTAAYDNQHLAFERNWRRAYARFSTTLPNTPDLKTLDQRLASSGHRRGDPLLMRIFKKEFELEIWMRKDGRYQHFATYPICKFSGRLGPKLKEGDRQSPEGFYTVSKGQLNPNSRWHRSFNLGYPNTHDKSHGRTGSFLMVHGGCSSIGCYAMTNAVMDEIWSLVTAALNNGQSRFQVQAFPFRMTDDNLKARENNQWSDFWADLKRGHDLFEKTRTPPKIAVCNKRYTFAEGASGSKSAPRLVKGCQYAPKLAATTPISTSTASGQTIPLPTRQPRL